MYGKTLQDVRNYIEVRLHTNAKKALKAASLHTFKHFSVIDENLVQTCHSRPSITHNTPIAIGVTVLELVNSFFIRLLSDCFIDKIVTILHFPKNLCVSLWADNHIHSVSNYYQILIKSISKQLMSNVHFFGEIGVLMNN